MAWGNETWGIGLWGVSADTATVGAARHEKEATDLPLFYAASDMASTYEATDLATRYTAVDME